MPTDPFFDRQGMLFRAPSESVAMQSLAFHHMKEPVVRTIRVAQHPRQAQRTKFYAFPHSLDVVFSEKCWLTERDLEDKRDAIEVPLLVYREMQRMIAAKAMEASSSNHHVVFLPRDLSEDRLEDMDEGQVEQFILAHCFCTAQLQTVFAENRNGNDFEAVSLGKTRTTFKNGDTVHLWQSTNPENSARLVGPVFNLVYATIAVIDHSLE